MAPWSYLVDVAVSFAADQTVKGQKLGWSFKSWSKLISLRKYDVFIEANGKRVRKPELRAKMASNTWGKAAQAGPCDAYRFCHSEVVIDVWPVRP
jgi:hypothetical protein